MKNPIKYLFDLVVSVTAIIFLMPVFVLISLMVWFSMGSPVLFCQKRPGLNGRPFTIYKFRTMTEKFDAEGNALPDENRLTAFGKLLRSTSLDELPELFNVVKGDMSLVGPRPLMMEYLPRYSPEQARRHDVKPGITGWAQINGRNAISWEEKFKLDVWYVENGNLWLDLQILWKTIVLALRKEGINQEGRATVDDFMGSSDAESASENKVPKGY